jgi:sulfite reductase beta subunit-like hemoprotein
MTNKLSEVAFVGKAPGTYLMLLGGGYYGQRLNKIYRGQLDLLYTRCPR